MNKEEFDYEFGSTLGEKGVRETIYKWFDSHGQPISLDFYKASFTSAKIKGIPFEDYLRSIGFSKFSTGVIQDPTLNSSKLVKWGKYQIKNGKKVIFLLSLWAYKDYYNKYGKNTGDYLREELDLSTLQEFAKSEKDIDRLTSWINLRSGEILTRGEYLSYRYRAVKLGLDFEEYLNDSFIYPLLDSKREIIKDIRSRL